MCTDGNDSASNQRRFFDGGSVVPRGTARRTACTALVAIMVSMLVAAGVCGIEIVRTPFDTAVGWGMALGFAVLGSVFMAGCWLLQFLRARRAGRASQESRRVLPLLGSCKNVWAPYLVLVAPNHSFPGPQNFRYERGVAELQRFLWDPAINRLCRGDLVLLRRHGRFAVVDLPDGTRLWPSGALRVKEPRDWKLIERPSSARTRYRELRERARAGDRRASAEVSSYIHEEMHVSEVTDPLDPVFDLPPEPATTRPSVGYAMTLMAVAGISTLAKFGPLPAIAAAIYAAGLAVHIWAWYGGDPDRA